MNTKQTEIGEIPADWEVVKLGEIFQFKNGLNKSKEYFGHGTPIVNYMDVYQRVSLVDTDVKGKVSVTPQEQRNYSAKKGDVFFTRTSETVEEIGLASVLLQDIPNCVYSGFLLRARATDDTDTFNPEFLSYYLRSNPIREQIQSTASYTTRALTNGKLLSAISLALPPLHEQTAIAAILSDTDRLLAALRALIGKKRAVKTAAMQQLLSGRLRLPGFAATGRLKNSELGEIPEDWEVVSYGDIFQFLSTSTNPRSDLTANGELLYLHYGDIHTKLSTHLNIAEISLPRISAKLVSSAIVKDGDVIMADASEDYDGIGKSVEVCNIGAEKMVSGLHTFLLRDADKRLADGYRGFLHCIPSVKRQFNALATGLKVYGVSKGNLKTVLLPLPPKPEQTAIAQTLSDMDSEIAALEARTAKLAQIKQGLMQNLLTGKIRVNTGAA